MKIENIQELKDIATRVRMNIVEMIYEAQSGHPGGSLSIADILTVLYFNEMNIDPLKPQDVNRDRCIISKGHASPALYSVLAEKGYFSKDMLKGFRKIDSKLQGHPDMNKVPGVDFSSGSLGQGLSISNGMAIAAKLNKANYRVYCIIGDGELEEGQIWESAMTSSHYKLDNICAIIDENGLQIDGKTSEVMNSDSISEKFKSFGFYTIEIDGNNIEEIIRAFEQAKKTKEKPTAIIAKTIKGKGVSFMENQVGWHGKAPNIEELEIAKKDLTKC